MLETKTIEENAIKFKEQMSRFVDFSNDRAIIVKNGDWLLNLNYIDFLRNVGRYFSVNKMLTAECFKTRLEKGLSFLEFNYMLMQSYDFLVLYKEYNCLLQLGGNDQWSNIINGMELIQRVIKKKAYGMTFNLLTTKEGKKMGKTQKGALWLDENKCSPFEFFQYWRNINDSDVLNCLKLLTFLPLEQIDELALLKGEEINKAKEILAYEVTKIVHGEEKATKAKKTSQNLFNENSFEKNMPTTVLLNENFKEDKIGLLNLLVICKLCESNSSARVLVEQGGISLNGKTVNSSKLMLKKEEFINGVTIKKGKKTFHFVKLKN